MEISYVSTVTQNTLGFRCSASSVNVLESSIYNNTGDITCLGGCSWSGLLGNETCNVACSYRDVCSQCDGERDCVGCDG